MRRKIESNWVFSKDTYANLMVSSKQINKEALLKMNWHKAGKIPSNMKSIFPSQEMSFSYWNKNRR